MPKRLRRTVAQPLWEQVRDLIHGEIRSGQFGPGDQLPTEQEYAARFGTSLNPVRAALQQLVNAGVIERTKGRGTFVLDRKIAHSLTLLSSCTDGLRRQGLAFTVDVLALGPAAANDRVRRALELPARRRNAVRIERLIYIEEHPTIVLRTWIPSGALRTPVDREQLESGASLYEALASQGLELCSASADLEVESADALDADLLNVPFGSPLLAVTSIARDAAGTPVETSLIKYNPKRISLTFERDINAELRTHER